MKANDKEMNRWKQQDIRIGGYAMRYGIDDRYDLARYERGNDRHDNRSYDDYDNSIGTAR